MTTLGERRLSRRARSVHLIVDDSPNGTSDAETVAMLIRVGAAAVLAYPPRSMVDAACRPKDIEAGLRVADEIDQQRALNVHPPAPPKAGRRKARRSHQIAQDGAGRESTTQDAQPHTRAVLARQERTQAPDPDEGALRLDV